MKLLGITTAQEKHYTVGESPEHLGDELVVEKVVYQPTTQVYNKAMFGGASYTVSFVDSLIRHIVPERDVSELRVDTTKGEKKKKKTSAAADETPDDFLESEENTADLAEGA